ncbi:helicase HerA-like domain-containing protein [Timonella senegalensis]|uniref:helicase HerA-like domain-containing protein n=1 Tax=Timonella senegalensis TaxID=1465825 RepID=UPI002FDC7F37
MANQDTAPDNATLAELRAQAAAAEAEAANARAAAAQAALEAAEARAARAAEEPAEVAEPTEPAEAPAPKEAPASPAPLSEYSARVAAAYAYKGGMLPLGALLEGEIGGEIAPNKDVQVGFALSMLNRHGLVAGATGTGKTKTLQGMAEGLSTAGVPVFLADIKGDLSGLATAATPNEALVQRTASIGQDWVPTAFPTQFYSLGGLGKGVPIRTTVSDFGPLLLSKALGLNDTQESSLGLIFHWADTKGLALLDLKDLRTTITYLTSDEGKSELKGIGGVSSATAGVILREIVTLQSQGADVFFGEPAFDTAELLHTTPDGRGVISALELPAVQDRPALFSTFLMWLLADLYQDLPEVGDQPKPKLVFFFDEAHLLFKGASKDFLAQVITTIRLVRSKGVGVFFVTQSPKDVPADVLAQLGNRVQHALRAFTPDDAAALKAAVRTYPTSPYDLERLLQSLGTGEAVVTVMNEKGAPTPVAWTRVRAPQSSMDPAPAAVMDQIVSGSPGMARYGTPVDNQSAHEILTARISGAAPDIPAPTAQGSSASVPGGASSTAPAGEDLADQLAREIEAEQRAENEAADRAAQQQLDELNKLREKLDRDAEKARNQESKRSTKSTGSRSRSKEFDLEDGIEEFLKSAGSKLGREITRTIFGTRRR